MGCVDGGPGGLFAKAQGNASGEDQGWTGTKGHVRTCKGPTPWLAGHNNPDGNNAYPGGRDHMIKMNGCTMPGFTTTPFNAGPMVEATQRQCHDRPASSTWAARSLRIFCTSEGRQPRRWRPRSAGEHESITNYGMWAFWMSLPLKVESGPSFLKGDLHA